MDSNNNNDTRLYSLDDASTFRKLLVRVTVYFVLIPLTIFISIYALLSSFGTVPAGYRGVHLRFNKPISVLPEGLYIKIPLVDDVINFKIQKFSLPVKATASSKDLQTVSAEITPNLHIEENSVKDIYTNVGIDYPNIIIVPALQESIKAVTAKYTAEELITKRSEVRDLITQTLETKLQGSGVKLDSINITNFDFSDSFNVAIENKVTAEQNALAAKNKLDQVKFEAEQAVAQADGKAQALVIEGKAVSENPQVLQARAIEKWNGVLPTVTGSNIPFINIK